MSSACAAQAYPVKPIRLVVPLAAGGTGDTLARVIGEEAMAKYADSVGHMPRK